MTQKQSNHSEKDKKYCLITVFFLLIFCLFAVIFFGFLAPSKNKIPAQNDVGSPTKTSISPVVPLESLT